MIARIGLQIGLRVAVTCWVVGSIFVGVLQRELFASLILCLCIVAWPLWLFATESETLPDECPVPPRRWMRLLVAPWLPGGGRGTIFLLLHLVSIFAAMALLNPGQAPVRTIQIGCFCVLGAIDVLLPCALGRSILGDWKGRAIVSAASFALVFGGLALGSLVGGSAHQGAGALFEQVVSPDGMFRMITRDGRFVGHPAAPVVLAVILVAAVVGNLRRMTRGVNEVVERSALERRDVRATVLG
jgi:hypothetical protein